MNECSFYFVRIMGAYLWFRVVRRRIARRKALKTLSNGHQAVLILAPSGGGKDTVIEATRQRLPVAPCIRETTRVPHSRDNGDYRYISGAQFLQRLCHGQYVLAHHYASNWYGVPLSEIQELWKAGYIPLLKGGIDEIPAAKSQLQTLRPGVHLNVIQLIPKTREDWLRALHERGLHDMEARIQESDRALHAAQGAKRYLINHFVDNRFGLLERTVDEVVARIQSA